MPGTRYSLEVQPAIPRRLAKLNQLANDLLYSWDRNVRGLFYRLDPDLWESSGHNPKVFLRRVSQQRLEEAADDHHFMEAYNRALSVYQTYHGETSRARTEQLLEPGQDLIAYFCAEFGLHESVPLYSGGLGILAGDHCKAASDLALPFVGVGILYRQGYFTQRIDADGRQIAQYHPTNFSDLPIQPAPDGNGGELHVQIELPGRAVKLRVWQVKAGHITIYLLDSDLPDNDEQDRSITYQLYGGDITTRIQQEIVLGMGGVRALRALQLTPTAWHINEGHAAFQVLERTRELVTGGLDFDSAWEAVASATVFTTHTPVAAGHDVFDHDLMTTYFADYVRELGIDLERFLGLGAAGNDINGNGGFNQTVLALKGSRAHNGVSRIHGEIAACTEAPVWPEVPAAENPIDYVTNGVHVPTFLAREWANLFDMQLGGEWRNELLHPEYWERIDAIPDHSYWSLHQSLKAELIDIVRQRLCNQLQRNGINAAQIERTTRYLEPDVAGSTLTVGFARRFATYKRAALLFSDPERLARLLNDPDRPVLVLFAGKAHPNDEPGQELIRIVHEYAQQPQFMGRILLVENYDLALARKLVTGVDVWLNTPEHPFEASGTSGQKAGINGVANLSVLDGWWDEGYDGDNGWAITPHGPNVDANYRDRQEAQELMDILEDKVIPLYYARGRQGYSEGWVRLSKRSMKSTMPRFNAERMVMDYVRRFYRPAAQMHRTLSAHNFDAARELAQWKRRVEAAWPEVTIRRLDDPPMAIKWQETVPVQVAVQLNGLSPDDVVLECLLGTESSSGEFVMHERMVFTPGEPGESGDTIFELDLKPNTTGLQHYKLRLYPFHRLLCHRFEMGYMRWL